MVKIQLLIAAGDSDYVEHLSNVLMEKYADVFEVSVCSSMDSLETLASHRPFNVGLLDKDYLDSPNVQNVHMPIMLWDESDPASDKLSNILKIRKFQRISTMVGEILERYAEVSGGSLPLDDGRAKIVLIWSPVGGCGKTTIALAYAAQQAREGKKEVYLNLEPFSSTHIYFPNSGKSISSVFEKLDGNVEMLLQSIRQTDTETGIHYYCKPDNYDDIGILSEEDIKSLVAAGANGVDELIIDTGSVYDQRIHALIEMADVVLMVIDASKASQTKLEQFQTQHNVYEKIREKTILVANKGARSNMKASEAVMLPIVKSDDPVVVYKTLSSGYFSN